MATYSAPQINGTALPDISSYIETEARRIIVAELASGTVSSYEYGDGTVRHDYRIGWQYLTLAQKGSVEASFSTISTAYTTGNFITPTGGTVTVTRHPEQPGLSWEATDSLGSLYWSGEMLLREV